jgi:hypothetical protein
VVVGTATVGAAAIHDREPDPSEERLAVQNQVAPVVDSSTNEREKGTRHPRVKQLALKKKIVAPVVLPVEEPPIESPVEAPPVAEEPPAPEPPSDPNGGTPPDTVVIDDPDPEPPLPPVSEEPQGFELSFDIGLAGPEPCDCISETAIESSSVGVSDQGVGGFEHVVTGSANAAGVPTYGLRLKQLSRLGSDHAMNITLRTSEGTYIYAANGALTDKTKTDWGGWVYRYSGSYHLSSWPTSTEPVPETGHYFGEVIVSWRQARIVETRVILD